MKKLSISLAVIIFLLSSIPSYGWDDVGHKITGYIAWQRMSDKAREEVIRILRKAPEDSHLSAFYFEYGPRTKTEKQLEYFMIVPAWADIVRDGSFPNRQKNYHRSNWHYSDIFWRQVNGKAVLIEDKQPGGQGLQKLIDFDKVMRDAGASDQDKAIAIAWFLHIGGDLHQPLHTSGRHTDREPDGDQGGNRFLLTPEGTKREDQVNLHWLWDSIVGRNFPIMPNECEYDYIRRVSESAIKRYPYPDRSSLMLSGEYDKWKNETFAFAPTDVFSEELKRFVMPGDGYLRNAYRVSEERLVMAGYRMGDTLEAVFGK